MDLLYSIASDHAPVTLQFSGFDRKKLSIKKWGYRFYFEEQWLESDKCQKIVKNGWFEDFFCSVKLTRDLLAHWSKIRQKEQFKRKNLK